MNSLSKVSKTMGHTGWGGLVLGLLLSTTCAKLEKEKLPVVVTSGSHTVVIGQTVALGAATNNGTDAAYVWASAAPAVATVDPATGVVTGVAVGETVVTATGTGTGAIGSHPIVVIAAAAVDAGPGVPPSAVPNYEKWLTSPHADPTAEAFVHWREEGAVPETCARCHSGAGFADYLGGDGSTPKKVDQPAPESVITCQACHNPAADTLSTVTFPSGVEITGLGGEARCMTCHQGRATGQAVDDAIAAAGLMDPDTVGPMLRFTNIHYYPAAATLYAGEVKGGYQYAGQIYDTRFRHVPGYDTCLGCHDPHSTKVKFNECQACHTGVMDRESARMIRMISSVGRDYDGDGNVTEGVGVELDGLRDKVLSAMSNYGNQRGTPICYNVAAYPYWFKDTDRDGVCSAGEVTGDNAFAGWTPRLLRAAYNYQMASKDPGAFAHNAKYILELLYDSITNLNEANAVKVDMSRAPRGDQGHFDGSAEAARHWDEEGEVSATCSKCHSGASGFRFYVEHRVSTEVPQTANGLECATCHTSFGNTFDVLEVKSTTFPSGVTKELAGYDNLCSTCHSGRESGVSVLAAVSRPRFINVHYLAGGAVKLGAESKVGFEYPGKTYAGPLTHAGGVQCTSCHDPVASQHSFKVEDTWMTRCQTCHADANGRAEAVRITHSADYDGDGNVTESLHAEIDGMAARVLAAMRAASPGLCYGAGSYPYFFKNDPATGQPVCAPGEATSAARFTAWTPALMKAAHNFQITRTDPGAWAHNFEYVGQILYDSVEDLTAAPPVGLTRP